MPPGVLPQRRPPRRGSTLDMNFSMDAQLPPTPGAPFYVVFIGAGGINFGTIEGGPWNHSFRLEHKLGPRLRVVALIDPNPATSNAVLRIKRQSFVEMAYRDTREFASLEDYLSSKPIPAPHAFIIGSPPAFHGGILPGKDVEIQISKAFPNTAMFVEKPISTSTVKEVFECSEYLKSKKHVISVGYMFRQEYNGLPLTSRYLKVVQKVRELLAINNLPVMGIIAYASCYPLVTKSFWWDKDLSCGPVVEQGTHFVDLCRYLGGDAQLETVQASALEHDDPAGKLSAMSINEEQIAPERRLPRVTAATWKFHNGAVCSFTHTLVLHGSKYDTELCIYSDGWQFRITDLYNNPLLYVRNPHSEGEELYQFKDDDPYYGEFSTFVDACEGHGTSFIASSFEDGAKTYELTWAIREASERRLA